MGIDTLARGIRSFLPPAVLNRLGGPRGFRMFIEKKALPTLNQYGANKVEQKIAKDLRAAEKFIGDKSEFKKRIQKDREGFNEPVQVSPGDLQLMTVGEGVAENRDAVVEAVIKRLLSED